jgi:hypothetical protein
MSHRTFRSLDEPPKLIGFSIRQWAALIAGGLALLGLVELAGLPTKAAITLAVFTLGLPAALMYVSEAGGLRIGVLLRDALTWRLAPKRLASETDEEPQREDSRVASAVRRGGTRSRGGRS